MSALEARLSFARRRTAGSERTTTRGAAEATRECGYRDQPSSRRRRLGV